MPGIDSGVASKFQKILQKQGFDFKLSTAVKSVSKGSNGLTVTVEDTKEGKQDTIEADKVLIAIGRRPYTQGLGLDVLYSTFFVCVFFIFVV